MSFSRQTTLRERQHDAIALAYRAAGVPAPNARTAALAAIGAEPTAATVALELARAAHATQDADKFLKDALARITRAQAADTLRAALGRAEVLIGRETIDAALERAAVDLGPRFAEIAKSFGDAAAKLDPERPLEVENAVRDDTTKELKTVQAALAALGPFASMYVQKHSNYVPPNLNAVLPVVELPECVVEVRVDSHTTNPRSVNSAELAETLEVRRFARELERDLDSGLVAAARGEYAGISISLASGNADLDRRVKNAIRAHKRRKATDVEARQRVVVA